jgi:hypothetical protein
MAQYVWGTYFSGLCAPALLGRTVTSDDDRPRAAAVAVLSYRFWKRRFNQDPRVLGSSITINRIPTTIVDVTAAPARVLRMVPRESVALLIAGIALGALAAYASGQVVRAVLFGLSASDPVTYVGAAAALGIMCLAATLIPARRASRIDPMVALRVE